VETTAPALTSPTAGPGAVDRMTATALRPARTLVRWGVRHALSALFLDRAARKGDPVGRLLRDTAVRDQPYGVTRSGGSAAGRCGGICRRCAGSSTFR